VIITQDVYGQYSLLFKALSDASRLLIVDMLSCGENCACNLLEYLHFSQPTLSHHMKILCDCGLVQGRRQGKWMYYSLNAEAVHEFRDFLKLLTSPKEDCICHKAKICLGEESIAGE